MTLTLALGMRLGNKVFNVMILTVAILFYRLGPLLADLAPVHANTAVALVAAHLVSIELPAQA